MFNRQKKFWPMTPAQSFYAAAAFLTILFLILLWPAIGRGLLCWIEEHQGLAAWIQALFSIVAIFGIWVQVNSSYKNQIKISKKEKLEKFIFAMNEISFTTKWLRLKLDEWDLLIVALSTGSALGQGAENNKALLMMELGDFERRLLKSSNALTLEAGISHQIEVLLTNIKRLFLKLTLNMESKEVIEEMLALKKNAESMTNICYVYHEKLHKEFSQF